MPQAIDMVSDLLSEQQQKKMQQSRLMIDQGSSLSKALHEHQLSDPVTDSLLKVGENPGQMAEMLERTARFADEDFARWLEWSSRLIEPLLMAIMGMVIGTIVVLMYLPIFELAGSLQ